VKNWFQAFAFKCNLYHYSTVCAHLDAWPPAGSRPSANPAAGTNATAAAAMMTTVDCLVGPLYKLNPVKTHSLQAPGDPTLETET
jgi:hypothetical protein